MTIYKHSLLISVLAASLVACGGDDDNNGDGSATADASSGGESDGGAEAPDAAQGAADAEVGDNEVVPSESDALFAYLQAGSYEGFDAEPSISNSGVHTRVRTYINGTLATSQQAGNPSHPVGSAAVKELYSAGTDNLAGWAVMVKVDDKGNKNDWYYYENKSTTNNNPVSDNVGDTQCTGCHSNGTDYIFTDLF